MSNSFGAKKSATNIAADIRCSRVYCKDQCAVLGSGDRKDKDRKPPVIFKRDIWLSAKAMIDDHGTSAGLEAAARADDLLEKGDLKGSAAWLRILLAIERLQAEKPAPGEQVQ